MLTVRNFSEETNMFSVASLKWKQTTSSILAFSSRTFVGTTVAKAMGWFFFLFFSMYLSELQLPTTQDTMRVYLFIRSVIEK